MPSKAMAPCTCRSLRHWQFDEFCHRQRRELRPTYYTKSVIGGALCDDVYMRWTCLLSTG